jgi:trk system potassium uptake protein TrkA
MKVVICGAGQVGSSIARYLAGEANDVTVIDQKPELVHKIADKLDVRGVVGFASHPDVLEEAGAADAEMLVAVTYADEVNMIACEVAHALFNVPTKIARVRHQSYLKPIWANLFSRDNLPIDVIISPEIEVARFILRRLELPGAFHTLEFADGKVRVAGVHCDADCPLIHTPLRQLTELFPELALTVIGIFRGEQAIVPTGDDRMLPGDNVYFACDSRHLTRALVAFGHEEVRARRVLIAGGGNIGRYLAEQIEAKHPDMTLKIIELDQARARSTAEVLKHGMVLQGDVLDTEILEEANIKATETFIAVTNDDEVNIIGSLLAKRSGGQRTVALVNKATYSPLVTTLGIDTVVSPRAITVSTILQHVRRGRIRAAYSLGDGFGEVIEGDALETSGLVGTPIRDIRLPDGIALGALVRGDSVIMPRGGTVIEAGDRVVLFAATGVVKKAERLFSVRLEFF